MKRIICISVLFQILWSCKQQKNRAPEQPIHFSSLPSSQTKINFNNTITESDSVNLIFNAYAYMGAGVGIGDFNNDGLPDIFFGANQQSSHMYINKGSMVFEDITEKAGLNTSAWVTGVSVIDINNDGYDDIYICVSGTVSADKRKNQLFINNKDLTFSEQAAAYGLNDTSYSSQAVFFDYDLDGDLDMYLLNHYLNHTQSNNVIRPDRSGNSPARDKLYRNTGVTAGSSHPVFEDVSMAAGINEDGYGLGVIVSDLNNDNLPDIYVANDYLASDVLWLNNGNGTFTNTIHGSLKHESYSSMGVDANDINNDGWVDILTLDMLPEDNKRKKLMYSFMNYERYASERQAGYEPQFVRNMLQLNNGVRTVSDTSIPFFSEIGQLAGISETDWSWSALLTDLDNDGWKDIYITNGLGRDMLHSDFVNFWASSAGNRYATWQERYKAILDKLNEYGTVALKNYCYRNNSNLTFSNVTEDAGLQTASISNGCAYADLDNDGDLDLVVNNINREAFILRNNIRKDSSDSTHNFITIRLNGDSLNKAGLGAKVKIYTGSTMQALEQSPVRGYLSSVDKRLHAGIGNNAQIDSIVITWPGGKQEKVSKLEANQTLVLNYTAAQPAHTITLNNASPLFTDASKIKSIDFVHKETPFYDYAFQQLLPQKYSQLGPFMATGDINGDGLTDFFIGGAVHQSGRIFTQLPDGRFESKNLTNDDKMQEDLGCLLVDVDGDQDLDLIVNSGGSEYKPGSPYYLPRLYKNDGKGNFTIDPKAFPENISTSAQCMAAADMDGDGDIDLFIGGRLSPMQYPVIPESYLLQNNGGVFTTVTKELCPKLQFAGMITAAVWTDLNNDKKPDLVVAGEWMPLRFFQNEGGKLTEVTTLTGLQNTEGLWRSVTAADVDQDGDMDIVAGNLGVNNKFKASPEFPVKLFADDFDGNGSVDPIIAYYLNNEKDKRSLFPAIPLNQLAAQLPSIRNKYLLNAAYAVSDLNAVLSSFDQANMLQFTCNETRSVWLENKGNGKFVLHPLPPEAQFAPLNSILCTDADGDGKMDMIMGGNDYQIDVMTGRYDASYGLFMKGDGKGNFMAQQPTSSGLIVDGDVKDITLITTAKNEKLLLVAVNDEPLKAYTIK